MTVKSLDLSFPFPVCSASVVGAKWWSLSLSSPPSRRQGTEAWPLLEPSDPPAGTTQQRNLKNWVDFKLIFIGVALPRCMISFHCTAERISYMDAQAPCLLESFHPGSRRAPIVFAMHRSRFSRSLSTPYTVSVVCTCQSYLPAPPWCPYVCCLCFHFCFASKIIYTIFLDYTYMP